MSTKFVVISDIEWENAWFKLCQSKQSVCVWVKKYRKYGDVHFDYFTLPWNKDHFFNSEDYNNWILNILDKYSINKSYSFWPTIRVERIPLETALLLAEDIYDYISNLIK